MAIFLLFPLTEENLDNPSPNLGHTEGYKFCPFLKYLFSSKSQPLRRKKRGGGSLSCCQLLHS